MNQLIIMKLNTIYGLLLMSEMHRMDLVSDDKYINTLISQFEILQKAVLGNDKYD